MSSLLSPSLSIARNTALRAVSLRCAMSSQLGSMNNNIQLRHYNSNATFLSPPPPPAPQVPWFTKLLGICLVPQQSAWIVERFGKYQSTLQAGIHFMIPLVERISYTHSLKEEAFPISYQTAVTKDNVTINIDGVLYVKITDPYKASYGVSNPMYAISQLAQTTMRSELGKISLDSTFNERVSLNTAIVDAINHAAADWGVQCMRYEIRDIAPPEGVKAAMHMQAEAERRKRATILDSESQQQSEVNVATGQAQSAFLQAEGEARAIDALANANARAILQIAKAVRYQGGSEAVSLRIAEKYIEAFGKLAKKGTMVVVPSNANDVSSFVTQAMAIYGTVAKSNKGAENQDVAGMPDPGPISDADEHIAKILDEHQVNPDKGAKATGKTSLPFPPIF